MATVSLKPGPLDSEQSADPSRKRRAPKRRRKGLLGVLAAMAVLLFFAPTLVAITSLRDIPLRMVFEGIDGAIHSGGASLGWFSPVVYRDVQVHDRQGQLLLSVPTVTIERTSLQLLLDRSRLGTVTLDQPEVNVVARDRSSNAEDVLLPWWNLPSSGPIEMDLAVVDGTVKLLDARKQWTVASLQSSLQLSLVAAAPPSFTAEGKITDDQRTGLFTVTSGTESPGAVQLKAQQVPLAMFDWLARRASGDVSLSGDLACELTFQSTSPRQSLRGQLGATNLRISGGPLQGDTLAIADLMITSDLELDGRRVHVKELTVDSELGRIVARGDFTTIAPGDRDALMALLRERFTVNGSLDLARTSRMLPKTLRIRSDTQIDDATVQFQLASDHADDEHRWQARLETGGLTATSAGRPVRWENPITIDLVARETKAGIVVDSLAGSASFLQLTGKGAAGNLTVDLQFDLDRLKADLGQVIDLGQMRLAGGGRAQLHWQRDDAGAFRATAAAQLKNFELGTSAATTWRETDLTAELTAAGRTTGAAISRLESAALRVLAAGRDGASDKLELNLREPLDTARAGATAIDRLPLLVHVSGDLAQWKARAAPWVDLRGWDVAGSIEAHANATWTTAACELHSLQAAIGQLQATNGRWFINEPRVKIATAGRYDANAETVEISSLAIESSAATLKSAKATVRLGATGSTGLRGQIEFTGDLAQLQRWTHHPAQPQALAWSGNLNGQADLAADADGTAAQIDATIENLVARSLVNNDPTGGPANPLRGTVAGAAVNRAALWQEKRLALAGKATYLASDDTVRLETLQIASDALKLQSFGEIRSFTSTADVNLQGQAEYDWSQLSTLLAPYFGKDVRIQGRETSKFAIRGPIRALIDPTAQTPTAASAGQPADPLAWTKLLTAQASTGWQQAEAFGLSIGKGALAADMRDGLVKFEPIELAVSEGRVRLSPQVLLTPAPAEIVHGQAKVIDHVRATPAMTSSWLKFIAPAVAEATQTQGELSLDLTGLKVPLFNPETASAVGRLEVHRLEVSPGAPARAVILLAEQIRALVERRPPPAELSRNPTLLSISDQQIDFRMAGGRVVHQGMTMNIGEVTIRTSGWVGFDETIGLVAEVPIKAEWVQKTPALASMQGQSLQIPIGGTLRRPQVDPRAWQQVVALFAQSAARGLIEDTLNKQLDRLFER